MGEEGLIFSFLTGSAMWGVDLFLLKYDVEVLCLGERWFRGSLRLEFYGGLTLEPYSKNTKSNRQVGDCNLCVVCGGACRGGRVQMCVSECEASVYAMGRVKMGECR